ncbi:hypothetical protein OsJ_19944 [Oryza sativa Japonica Group]|uniref:Uncharacterized protein n=1 Tax=Oryza sativa subsp. japonica TaxID=39947 RepID=B9FR92_ORYSJ|nr:hypothetical protein OsJ_19944 [Oryza sativa Japonica Group]
MGMEDDAAGRGTTVPFLVAVRFVVALAVGAVTFAVIVMVIAMVSRPEEIQLSIDRGYITVYDDYGSEVLPTATTSLAAILHMLLTRTEDTCKWGSVVVI